MSHAPELVKSIENAILNVASRPRALRGPFLLDNGAVERWAKTIKSKRRAALRPNTDGETNG